MSGAFNPQIVFGVLAAAQGCWAGVFEVNTVDPTNVAIQIGKLRKRFGLSFRPTEMASGSLTTAVVRPWRG